MIEAEEIREAAEHLDQFGQLLLSLAMHRLAAGDWRLTRHLQRCAELRPADGLDVDLATAVARVADDAERILWARATAAALDHDDPAAVPRLHGAMAARVAC